jgi:hypothetical protein
LKCPTPLEQLGQISFPGSATHTISQSVWWIRSWKSCRLWQKWHVGAGC